MKVIATDVSRRYNLRLKELHRVANPGEIFEVTEDRFVYLNGNNPRGYVVVEWYQEPEEVEVKAPVVEEVVEVPVVEEVVEEVVEPVKVEAPVEEKPKKKTTKKKAESTEEKPKKKTTKKKVEDKAE